MPNTTAASSPITTRTRPVHRSRTSEAAATVRAYLGEVPTFEPTSAEYAGSTAALNHSARQQPGLVVRPRSADELAQTVRVARTLPLTLSVQATGHGAARTLGPATVLLDTSALTTVRIDAAHQVARAGAGATWAALQRSAAGSGLLGLAGTSGSVGIAGYTFGGGVGWFARPYGLAAGYLRAVQYIDGQGRIRQAADEANDPLDREAIWAFRGGAPVGIATDLTMDLVRPGRMWAGHLLWPVHRAERLIATWAESLPELPASVTSTIALLHLPPSDPFPADLLGSTVVHLSYASVADRAALMDLRARMRAVARPAVDSTGPADAKLLGQIHLDPPGPVAAAGGGRWLTAAAGDRAAELLLSARVGRVDGLAMAELRHVASTAPVFDGALTRAPGPFLFHTVGHGEPEAIEGTRAAIETSMRVAAPLDAGGDPVSFRDGDPRPAQPSRRLAAVSEALDPRGVFAFERIAGR